MNFSARRPAPGHVARLRPRILGVTVAALVAVPFGAVPAGPAPAGPAPAASAPATPAPADLVLAGPARVPAVAKVAASPVAVPVPPDVDRVPVRLGPGEVIAPPAPAAATLERSMPTRLHIPAIGVDSELVGLGLQDDGRMEVPPGAFPAGWYTGAPTPGELGPAILAGHVDYSGSAGVFFRLRELAPGDPVEVVRADGSTVVFRVTHVEQHAKDAFPTAAVYGDIDHAGLRLITCGGAFDRAAHSYEDNIVVFAELDTGR